MRNIKRKVTCVTVPVLESSDGKVTELGRLELIGNQTIKKIRNKMLKEYPDKNCFMGNIIKQTIEYSMTMDDFMKYSKKEVVS